MESTDVSQAVPEKRQRNARILAVRTAECQLLHLLKHEASGKAKRAFSRTRAADFMFEHSQRSV